MPETLDELFAPLREAESRHDPAAIAASRRRPRARYAIALAGVSGAAAVALLAAPASEEDSAPRTGAAILRAAAAVAADQPPLPAGEGYRYTRTLHHTTHSLREEGREAIVIAENPVESWENAQLEGHSVYGTSRILSREGDPALIERLMKQVPYRRTERVDASVAHGGLGPVPKPADLPTEPGPLRAALERHIVTASRWRKGLPTETMVRNAVLGTARWLLTEASSTPQLRAALFRMLAELPGARSVGSVRDPLGRTGEGIAMRGAPALPYEFTLVIDPRTAEVLATSYRFLDPAPGSGATIARETVITAAGQVRAPGERP